MNKSPDAFRTISEVAEALDIPAHVLRFWESRFAQVKPVKRAGGRRYYRPADMALLEGIRKLLHDDGMTIKGVQKVLREKGVRHVAGLGDPDADASDDAPFEQDAQPEARDADVLTFPAAPVASPGPETLTPDALEQDAEPPDDATPAVPPDDLGPASQPSVAFPGTATPDPDLTALAPRPGLVSRLLSGPLPDPKVLAPVVTRLRNLRDARAGGYNA